MSGTTLGFFSSNANDFLKKRRKILPIIFYTQQTPGLFTLGATFGHGTDQIFGQRARQSRCTFNLVEVTLLPFIQCFVIGFFDPFQNSRICFFLMANYL